MLSVLGDLHVACLAGLARPLCRCFSRLKLSLAIPRGSVQLSEASVSNPQCFSFIFGIWGELLFLISLERSRKLASWWLFQ